MSVIFSKCHTTLGDILLMSVDVGDIYKYRCCLVDVEDACRCSRIVVSCL